jgi:hypothetical protein
MDASLAFFDQPGESAAWLARPVSFWLAKPTDCNPGAFWMTRRSPFQALEVSESRGYAGRTAPGEKP